MKYAADVMHHSIHPQHDDRFSVSVEAGDEIEAARSVAGVAARRRWADDGSVSYVEPMRGAGRYRAAIGMQMRSDSGLALRGVTISIHVWPVG